MSDLLCNNGSAPALPERGMLYPPSSHMQLGRGLSNFAKSRRSSCFEMGTCLDEEMEASGARPSFSESDIASLLGASENTQINDTKQNDQMHDS